MRVRQQPVANLHIVVEDDMRQQHAALAQRYVVSNHDIRADMAIAA